MRKKKKAAKGKQDGSAAYNIKRDGITNSLLQKWLSCRVAAMHYLNGIRLDGIKTKRELGSIFHELLEQWYGDVDQTVDQVFGSTAQKWLDKTIEDGSDLQQMESVLAQARALFVRYCLYYAKDDAKKKWLQLEGVFDVEWNGYRLRGRCDGLYEDKNGKTWLLETKTKSQIPQTLDTGLIFDPQNLLYLLAKEQETGRKIMGVLYNVIRSPSLRQKQTETTEQYFSRIEEDIEARPEHYFLRYELRYTEKQRKDHREDLEIKLQEFNDWCERKAPHYRSECSCTRGWPCEYLELCASQSMDAYRADGTLFAELED